MSTVAILKRARELISNRANWIRGEEARTSPRGSSVFIYDPEATCFCSYGAVRRAFSDISGRRYDDVARSNPMAYLNDAVKIVHPGFKLNPNGVSYSPTIQFNDRKRTRHEQILKMFDVAIENASK